MVSSVMLDFPRGNFLLMFFDFVVLGCGMGSVYLIRFGDLALYRLSVRGRLSNGGSKYFGVFS